MLCISAKADPFLDTPVRQHTSSLLIPLFFAGVPLFFSSTAGNFFPLWDLWKYFSSSSLLYESTVSSCKSFIFSIILCLQLHAVEWNIYTQLPCTLIQCLPLKCILYEHSPSRKVIPFEYDGFPMSSTNLCPHSWQRYICLPPFVLPAFVIRGCSLPHLGHM